MFSFLHCAEYRVGAVEDLDVHSILHHRPCMMCLQHFPGHCLRKLLEASLQAAATSMHGHCLRKVLEASLQAAATSMHALIATSSWKLAGSGAHHGCSWTAIAEGKG